MEEMVKIAVWKKMGETKNIGKHLTGNLSLLLCVAQIAPDKSLEKCRIQSQLCPIGVSVVSLIEQFLISLISKGLAGSNAGDQVINSLTTAISFATA